MRKELRTQGERSLERQCSCRHSSPYPLLWAQTEEVQGTRLAQPTSWHTKCSVTPVVWVGALMAGVLEAGKTRKGVLQGMDTEVIQGGCSAQSDRRECDVGVMVMSWLQPVPSTGLSPVPLGGVPNLAVSVPPSSGDYSFNLSVCTGHSQPENSLILSSTTVSFILLWFIFPSAQYVS